MDGARGLTVRISHLAVQWPRFGPYHVARLGATHDLLARHGIRLTGLETASADAAYAWDTRVEQAPWQHVCAFPGRDYRALAPREMEKGVWALLDRLDPDAVAIHTYSLPDSRACLRWCRRRGRGAILMWDSRYEDAPRRAWWEGLKRRMVAPYDAALASGTDAVRYLEKLGMPAHRISTGYDVVDNAFFATRAEAVRRQPEAWRHLPGLDAPEPFFLSVSRFLALKNLDGLLRAYAAYRAATPHPWRLVLAGDGPTRPALEALIERERIEGVTLTGFMQMDSLPAYYALAAALVHPAHKDTWGLVVNEAMAAGLPVAVSRETGCVADLVEEGRNGYLFASTDESALAAVLARLHAHADALPRMGAASRETIACWGLDRFATGMLAAVRQAAPPAPGPLAPDVRALHLLLSGLARTADAFHQTPS